MMSVSEMGIELCRQKTLNMGGGGGEEGRRQGHGGGRGGGGGGGMESVMGHG